MIIFLSVIASLAWAITWTVLASVYSGSNSVSWSLMTVCAIMAWLTGVVLFVFIAGLATSRWKPTGTVSLILALAFASVPISFILGLSSGDHGMPYSIGKKEDKEVAPSPPVKSERKIARLSAPFYDETLETLARELSGYVKQDVADLLQRQFGEEKRPYQLTGQQHLPKWLDERNKGLGLEKTITITMKEGGSVAPGAYARLGIVRTELKILHPWYLKLNIRISAFTIGRVQVIKTLKGEELEYTDENAGKGRPTWVLRKVPAEGIEWQYQVVSQTAVGDPPLYGPDTTWHVPKTSFDDFVTDIYANPQIIVARASSDVPDSEPPLFFELEATPISLGNKNDRPSLELPDRITPEINLVKN